MLERIEKEDPSWMKSQVLHAEPKRENERTDIELPNQPAQSMEIELPVLTQPVIDTELPIRAYDRKEKLLPK
jgi:hypothetical protein